MVTKPTLAEMRTIVHNRLKAHSEYLGVKQKDIQLGEVGEDESKPFNVKKSFIRVYLFQSTPSDINQAGRKTRKKGILLCLVGTTSADTVDSSVTSYELGEKVEALLHGFGDIHRLQEPIFPVKRLKGVSIFGVSFFFIYDSSAQEEPWPNQ